MTAGEFETLPAVLSQIAHGLADWGIVLLDADHPAGAQLLRAVEYIEQAQQCINDASWEVSCAAQ